MDQRTLNMQDRRDRIVDAAERLIMRDSLSAFTMRGLADEVGLSVKTLYNLCSDKEAIAAEVEDRAFASLEAELRELPVDGDPIDQAIDLMVAAADKAIHRKAIVLPLIRAKHDADDQSKLRPIGFMGLGAQLAENALMRATKLGLLDSGLHPGLVARQLTLSWFGTAMLWGKGIVTDAEFVVRVRHVGACTLLPHAEGAVAARLRHDVFATESELLQHSGI